MEPQTVELEHFKGLGLLSGVWFTEADIDEDQYNYRHSLSSHVYFMLDAVIYVARENPDDGYRSTCRDVLIDNTHMPVNIWLPPEEVFCNYLENERDQLGEDDKDNYRMCDLVEMISVQTKKLVLTFGTTNTNDYYPSFVAHFQPENMGINERHANLFGLGEGE